jgi:hypothetical protein
MHAYRGIEEFTALLDSFFFLQADGDDVRSESETRTKPESKLRFFEWKIKVKAFASC